MTLIESFCLIACTLHSISFWPKSPCKKSEVPARDSGSSCGLRESTPDSKLCDYKIMAEHSLPFRLFSQCLLLQQKNNRAGLWIFCHFYDVKQSLEWELSWAAILLLLHHDTSLNSNLQRLQLISQNLLTLTLKDSAFSMCNLFSFVSDILE